jgi:hypothetical protein
MLPTFATSTDAGEHCSFQKPNGRTACGGAPILDRPMVLEGRPVTLTTSESGELFWRWPMRLSLRTKRSEIVQPDRLVPVPGA